MKSMAGNHLWEEKPVNQDEILWLEIIPARRNQQIEMEFRAGNHPWEEKPANQDEFYGWKSSLGGENSK